MGIIGNEKKVGEEAFLGFDFMKLMESLRSKRGVEGIIENVEYLMHVLVVRKIIRIGGELNLKC